jgi:hypothetical protein
MNSQIKKFLEQKKEENRLLEEQKRQSEILKEEKRKKKEEKIAISNKKFNELKINKTVLKEEKIIKTVVKKEEKIEEPIQKNYSELKKKSVLTDKFINLVDNIKFDEKDTPRTPKGMETKTKEILAKINKKLEKIPEEELEIHYINKRRLSQSDD